MPTADAPAPDQAAPTAPQLSKTARDLVEILRFREDLGTSYLVQAGRGRHALVVPTMLAGNPLERHHAYNWPTIRSLIDAGIVTVSGGRGVDITYRGRQRLDIGSADVIALTHARPA